MPLANSAADFQFPLEDQFEGRLFTRRKDLSNDLRLLIDIESEVDQAT